MADRETTQDVFARVDASINRVGDSGMATLLKRMVERESRLRASRREAEARRLALCSLRPRLRWLVDHPRLLDWVCRLRLARRPVMRIYVDGRIADAD